MRGLAELPVIVIGAGPVGLAAAARLIERGITPLILERGPSVGTSLRAWSHVRLFSPWQYNVDEAARSLLAQTGWDEPSAEALPTGAELVQSYLEPLARHPAIAPQLRYDATVVAISRQGIDKVASAGREAHPFVVEWRDAGGGRQRTLGRAVIDASGTWHRPNPMGVDGLFVPGERETASDIVYGIPDVLGSDRAHYAGQRVLVVGAGHSAINVALDLVALQKSAPETRLFWALRRGGLDKLLGGGLNDQLPERGALGLAAVRAIEEGRLEMLSPFAAEKIERTPEGLVVSAQLAGRRARIIVDRIVVATGFRPDLDFLRELRIVLDPAIETPPALAPLIDPNLHSCGTVRPHGAAELSHPEPGFYIVGAKSYGRAPTFLMVTGYEQARSVAAEIDGDHAAARDVRLVLPETGVCSAAPILGTTVSSCCGGPAPAAVEACCAADANAKEAGEDGCGCSSQVSQQGTTGCCGARA